MFVTFAVVQAVHAAVFVAKTEGHGQMYRLALRAATTHLSLMGK